MSGPVENTSEYRDAMGQVHRDDGPAVVLKSGMKMWYRHGLCHRVDGPAIVYCDSGMEWWMNGQRHRLGGPAVSWSGRPREYWVNGRKFTEDEFYRYVDHLTGEVLVPIGRRLWHEFDKSTR
jgi:hypothetical protein